MHISNSDQGVNFLSQQFPQAAFYLYRSQPESYISCFVCWLKDEADLLFLWKKVASVIAYEYQAELENKFDAWNIYLTFVTPSVVAKKTKYEIENDKFSMRKLVISDVDYTFDPGTHLNNEILGADLELSPVFSFRPPADEEELSELHKQLNQLLPEKKANPTLSSENILYLAKWVSDNEI
ncbi:MULTISPECIES: ABC-three component system middle component 1 [Enterobacterales]|uniref:ABC-three component system middle component 1 n=1 Tax=Enterobacterales TaxID=91347 RepID=UPI001F291F1C|nr:ABC-three component system middle component 1 [Pectobacterium versatile]